MKHHRKVLIITDTFMGMAGSEKNINQLMAGIDKDKFELSLACIYSGDLAKDLRERGCTVLDLLHGGIYTGNGLKNLLFLKRFITEKKISLLVTYHEASDFYGLMLSILCGVPVISSRRDMGFKTRFRHQIAYRLLGRLFDAEITVCDAVKNEMVRRGWFQQKHIFTIYNGVDLTTYCTESAFTDSIKKRIGLRQDSLVVGLIANMRRIKGIHYFIKAASLVVRELPNVEFIVIGGDTHVVGESIKDMQEVARAHGVDRHVHFLGRRRDIPELIAVFDVACLSSLSEGFSNTILEYMASGKPVVATNVGGNAEAIVDNVTGLLVPPGDADALASGLLRLLGDSKLALAMGKAARKRIEEKFSLDRMLENYESVFEAAISARSRARSGCSSDSMHNEVGGAVQ